MQVRINKREKNPQAQIWAQQEPGGISEGCLSVCGPEEQLVFYQPAGTRGQKATPRPPRTEGSYDHPCRGTQRHSPSISGDLSTPS